MYRAFELDLFCEFRALYKETKKEKNTQCMQNI